MPYSPGQVLIDSPAKASLDLVFSAEKRRLADLPSQGSAGRSHCCARKEEEDSAGHVTLSMLEQISEISTPHMKAINEAVEAAFPGVNPDVMHTAALGFQLGALLRALNDEARPEAVELINKMLSTSEVGYALAAVREEVGGHP
jgi:hypothetical protein